ncbi:tail fiber assembly protein [Aeromonas allosaccharophila]|uniref:tail fiber assembly protein n=1 Tax=Aeromonas allosaccharophila TaxID=656 RepID=UPI0030040392
MTEQRVIFGDGGFALESGFAFAHCINQSTGELLCSQDVFVVAGTGLPSGSFLDAPPQPVDGKAVVRQNCEWVLVDDLRGTTAYHKLTKQSEVITLLGPLSSELTLISPSSKFDVWSEESDNWVKDHQAEQDWLTQLSVNKRSSLLGEAGNEIAALLDALDPEVISDPDYTVHAKLLEWKQYRAALAVIDCSVHPVQWPAKPV